MPGAGAPLAGSPFPAMPPGGSPLPWSGYAQAALDQWFNAFRPFVSASAANADGRPAATAKNARAAASDEATEGSRTIASSWQSYAGPRWNTGSMHGSARSSRRTCCASAATSTSSTSDPGKPPVLVFEYDMVLDGREFERPANYALVRIRPPAGYPATDPNKRPFVVIDPRAGHGPGIGGFKMDSEIGIALQARPSVLFRDVLSRADAGPDHRSGVRPPRSRSCRR